MRLKNKIAIVTGGASGIGLATVKAFLSEGAKVVVSDVNLDGEKVVATLGHNDQVRFFPADVTKEEEIQQLMDQTIEWFGTIDVVFANAGIGDATPAHELSYESWSDMINVNLSGVFLTNKIAIQQMLKQNGGAIINNASILGHVGKENVTAYTASKGGVVNLTRSLGVTYAKEGIRINAVCPGYIETPLLKDKDEAKRNGLIAAHPIGRLGRAEEVANAVVFLASDEASFIVGENLKVDGGYTAQ
ncbi:short-chain dehydrogenase [Alkalihalophilus pseudofirmus]|nr:short-chain dehydrogenase [Alkalihalophilus pseudofirmus]